MVGGDLVRLREYRAADRRLFRSVETDTTAGFAHRDGPGYPWDDDELDAAIARRRTVDGQRYLFVVATQVDDAAIGWVAIDELSHVHRSARLALVLASGHRSRGYGSEATRRACVFAFDGLGLHRLWATLLADDEGAVAWAERAGFVAESRRPLERFHEGRRRDVLVVGLLGHEWRSRAGEATT